MAKKDKSRRIEILEKAAHLFHKRGYAATSIRDIAREMGMESASLYNHIKSKQEILQSFLIPLAKQYTKSIHEINAAPLTSIEKLERIIASQVRITIENTDGVSLIPNEWVHLDGDALGEFIEMRNEYEQVFKAIFEEAINDGFIRPVNIEIASFSILSTLRWLYSWYSKNKNINTLELEKELVINLIGGLKT